MLITTQRELEGTLQEAVKLKVNTSVPDETKKVLKEAEGMRMKWEGDCKAKEESVVCKAEEEKALCKGKEPAHSDGGEHAHNKAVHLFDDDTSPTCEAEEEEREPTPAVKPTAKPVPAKRLEFHVMRVMPASSPSVHGSTHSMEVMIPIQWKVSRMTLDWTILTGYSAPIGGRAR